MSFFEGVSGIGDLFDKGLEVYLETERIKASQPTQTAVNEQQQLIGIPPTMTENVNASPVPPEQRAAVNSDRVKVLGVDMSKQALYIAAAALGVVVLAKVL